MLWLVQRLFYGPESKLASSKPADDIHFGELAVLAPLVVLMLVMGLAPSFWTNSIQSGVHQPSISITNAIPASVLQIPTQGEAQR